MLSNLIDPLNNLTMPNNITHATIALPKVISTADKGSSFENNAVAPSNAIVTCRDHKLFLTGSNGLLGYICENVAEARNVSCTEISKFHSIGFETSHYG